MKKDIFINAIHNCELVRLTFLESSNNVKVRTCVPFDYGPSRHAKNKADRYHFWDIDSPNISHTLSLLPESVINIEPVTERFVPADYVKWTPSWYVSRDWGKYS